MLPASWGCELWDGYDSVLCHLTTRADLLVDVYAKFCREKAELEKEYAKGLRKLVSRYEPVKNKRKKEETKESTEISSFRKFLTEAGYQAGQHEVLAECLSKVLVKDIQKKSAEILKKTKDNSKHAKKEKDNMDASYFNLEKIKLKYEKSFHDWKEADRNFQIADQDGTISRNEIMKMKMLTESKCKTYENCRAQYADQLTKTNTEQREYFADSLPRVLNSLQDLDRERIQFVRGVMDRALHAEREAVKITNKCREGMEEAINGINEETDQEEVIERLKTGDLSPPDIEFEEMQILRHKKSSSLTRRLSRVSFSQKKGKQNLFQTKRNILKNIEKHQVEIAKGTKEMKALQLMIQTYTETPDFGDSRNFQDELNIVVTKVENLSKDLNSLNRELDLVESKMNLNMRHSLLAAPSRSSDSLDNSTQSGGSDSIGYGSQCSQVGGDIMEDSLHDKGDVIESAKEEDQLADVENNEKLNTEVYGMESTLESIKCSLINIDNSSEAVCIQSGSLSDDSEEEFEDEPIQPPQPCLVALYPYDGGEEGTLSMEEGEEFEVAGEDVDGWIKVKRKNLGHHEGYVPFAFTQRL